MRTTYIDAAPPKGMPVRPDNRHLSPLKRLMARIQAYFIVRDIKRGLAEVDRIESGHKRPKSIDQLLNEL